MGIQDRDYMRRGPPGPPNGPSWRKFDWKRSMVIAGAAIGLASAAIWLYRDARSVMPEFGPAEGSLRVNINTATQEELETVPGIGPARATQIIAGRPYSSVDDLVRLNGIGPATVDGMRTFLTTEGETEKL